MSYRSLKGTALLAALTGLLLAGCVGVAQPPYVEPASKSKDQAACQPQGQGSQSGSSKDCPKPASK